MYSIATKLDKSGATSTWQPLEWEPAQRLAIRQLMLGHTAKADEYNVVEVSSNKREGIFFLEIDKSVIFVRLRHHQLMV